MDHYLGLLMEEILVSYVRWAVFELACGDIDHRNYSHPHGETSKLKNYVEELNDSEAAIKKVVKELLEIEDIVNCFDEINNMNSDNDELDDMYNDCLDAIINFIGIYEINNLHEDDRDKFIERFKKCFN